MKVSNCCGAEMKSPLDEMEICPDCKEHCAVEEEDDEEMTLDSMDRF